MSRLGVKKGGEATNSTTSYHRAIGDVRYELTDLTGSVRVLVSDVILSDNGIQYPDLTMLKDYDAYGAVRSNRTLLQTNELGHRYAFQGMRLLDADGNLAEYRTPFRLYDGRTGRWNSIDPVVQPWTSPYEGLGSQPISNADPYGLLDNPIAPKSNQPFRPASGLAYKGGPIPSGTKETEGIIEGLTERGKVVGQAVDGVFERNGITYSAQIDKDGKGVFYTAVPTELMQLGLAPEYWIISPADAKKIHEDESFARSMSAIALTYNDAGKISGFSKSEATGNPDYFANELEQMWKESLRDPGYLASVFTATGAARRSAAAARTSKRAFFSGAGTEARAIEDGFQTLSKTRAGQNLNELTKGMEYRKGSPAFEMWSRLSSMYAKGIPKGSTVYVYLNNPHPEGIWNMIEKPILQSRGINIIEIWIK